jgi:hypothetical protein
MNFDTIKNLILPINTKYDKESDYSKWIKGKKEYTEGSILLKINSIPLTIEEIQEKYGKE